MRSGPTRSWALIGAACAVVATVGPATAQDATHAWCPEPEARQFDFWLGEWDVQNLNRPPGGDAWFPTGRATNRVYGVVGGCVVVEHWRGHAFPSAGHIAGFSVRTWDPEAHQWDLALLWPIGAPPRFGTFHGRFEGGRGEFLNRASGPDGDTVVTRLLFTDVTADSFEWSNGVSRDGGATWDASWRMEQTRRPPGASALWNGMVQGTGRCPDEEHRAVDGMLGEWSGERRTPGDDPVTVSTSVVRILDGCAVMERTVADDGSWEGFSVRAWEPAGGRWVAYATASDRRGLRRRQGTFGPEGGSLVDAEAWGGTFMRTRWERDGDALTVVRERASARGGPWDELDRTRLGRVPARPAGGP